MHSDFWPHITQRVSLCKQIKSKTWETLVLDVIINKTHFELFVVQRRNTLNVMQSCHSAVKKSEILQKASINK